MEAVVIFAQSPVASQLTRGLCVVFIRNDLYSPADVWVLSVTRWERTSRRWSTCPKPRAQRVPGDLGPRVH